MTKKQTRQSAILDLVARHLVGSQEELRQLLTSQGMVVTQATLSRDLRDLGLARVTDEDGVRYVLPESLGGADDKPLLAKLLPQLFSRIDGVGELIVLHTVRSAAVAADLSACAVFQSALKPGTAAGTPPGPAGLPTRASRSVRMCPSSLCTSQTAGPPYFFAPSAASSRA